MRYRYIRKRLCYVSLCNRDLDRFMLRLKKSFDEVYAFLNPKCDRHCK